MIIRQTKTCVIDRLPIKKFGGLKVVENSDLEAKKINQFSLKQPSKFL
jgi:hypothetical protein